MATKLDWGFCMHGQIALVEDGPGSYRFTFSSARGELSGRVTVASQDHPTAERTQTENKQRKTRSWRCLESSQSPARAISTFRVNRRLLFDEATLELDARKQQDACIPNDQFGSGPPKKFDCSKQALCSLETRWKSGATSRILARSKSDLARHDRQSS
jgi:hypothetical protein